MKKLKCLLGHHEWQSAGVGTKHPNYPHIDYPFRLLRCKYCKEEMTVRLNRETETRGINS
jgi:hypothetical protein